MTFKVGDDDARLISPDFWKGTMYRDMKIRTRYTLEELGL